MKVRTVINTVHYLLLTKYTNRFTRTLRSNVEISKIKTGMFKIQVLRCKFGSIFYNLLTKILYSFKLYILYYFNYTLFNNTLIKK